MTLKFKRAQKKVLLCTQFRRGALNKHGGKKSLQNHFILIKVESTSHKIKKSRSSTYSRLENHPYTIIKLLSPEPTLS